MGCEGPEGLVREHPSCTQATMCTGSSVQARFEAAARSICRRSARRRRTSSFHPTTSMCRHNGSQQNVGLAAGAEGKAEESSSLNKKKWTLVLRGAYSSPAWKHVPAHQTMPMSRRTAFRTNGDKVAARRRSIRLGDGSSGWHGRRGSHHSIHSRPGARWTNAPRVVGHLRPATVCEGYRCCGSRW